MTTTYAVLSEGLEKRFGAVRALRGLDLAVAEGTVCGLLGPNGAGKTTAVRLLTTLLRPDAGSARVAGLDLVREAAAVRRRIGVTGQDASVDGDLTGRQNLRLFARLHRVRRAAARADELLDHFGLTEAADRPAATLSGGQRRRLDLAASLVRRPGRPSEYREMTVEARAGRAAPAGDRRDPCPAAHCYLFHVTPHPYESTRPGQGNPIAPVRHACIAVTGFTFPVRGLTITLRIGEIPGRVGQPAARWRGRPPTGPPAGPTVTARYPGEPVERCKPEALGGVSRWHGRGARGRTVPGHPGAPGSGRSHVRSVARFFGAGARRRRPRRAGPPLLPLLFPCRSGQAAPLRTGR
ncbi:Vitamin B12 import ATP-binding protein BtuD [Streptomyces tendae]